METVIQNTITNHKIMLDQHCKAIRRKSGNASKNDS